MNRKFTLCKMGDAAGIAFPKEMLDRLGLKAGDDVAIVETDEGVLVKPFDPDLDGAMDAFDVIHRKYPNAFRELAR